MKKLLLICLLFGSLEFFAQGKIPTPEAQIRTALYAAPEMYKDGAAVLGYNKKGELVTLREGKNHLTCLADDPGKEGISVACYSSELNDFMQRGRELISEGKSEKEKREIRKKEIESESLKMPKDPAIVYVVSAAQEDFDASTGILKKHHLRYALYKPFMTAESTGLPTKPEAPGMPWLMDAGTHRAHIMITPPKE